MEDIQFMEGQKIDEAADVLGLLEMPGTVQHGSAPGKFWFVEYFDLREFLG